MEFEDYQEAHNPHKKQQSQSGQEDKENQEDDFEDNEDQENDTMFDKFFNSASEHPYTEKLKMNCSPGINPSRSRFMEYDSSNPASKTQQDIGTTQQQQRVLEGAPEAKIGSFKYEYNPFVKR